MRFSEIVEQAKDLLQRKGRITYRALKREFDLADEALEDLRDELIEAEQVAVDENGRVLAWIGNGDTAGEARQTDSQAELAHYGLSAQSFIPLSACGVHGGSFGV